MISGPIRQDGPIDHIIKNQRHQQWGANNYHGMLVALLGEPI